MNNKKLISRIYQLMFLSFAMLTISGCSGGGGGGVLGSLFGGGASAAGSGASFASVASTTVATVVNPEPSSILLLSSGLIGIAIYAKARLKIKNKK